MVYLPEERRRLLLRICSELDQSIKELAASDVLHDQRPAALRLVHTAERHDVTMRACVIARSARVSNDINVCGLWVCMMCLGLAHRSSA